MADVVDVDAARRDVGRDEHAGIAVLERVEGRLSGILALVAVDRLGADVGGFKRSGDAVGAALGACEHDHAIERLILQQGDESGALFLVADVVHALVDAIDRLARALDFDTFGIAQQVRGEGGDVRRHGGREQQRLALLRQQADDALDVVDEAHVEHAVGFVEHEVRHLVERDMLGADQVEQAPGRCNDDVDAAVHGAHLRPRTDAAVDDGVGDRQMLAVGLEAVADLDGQFARRRQDQRAAGARRGLAVLRVEHLQDWQRERRCLAGAGFGEAEQVAALQERRDGLGLDRRRRVVVLFVQCLQECRSKVQVGERWASGFCGRHNGRRGGSIDGCSRRVRDGIGHKVSAPARVDRRGFPRGPRASGRNICPARGLRQSSVGRARILREDAACPTTGA